MYIIPTFNGEAIFGLDVIMQTSEPSRERQINAFLGINGTEALDLGSRLRRTMVTGRLTGDSPGAVGQAEAVFRAYHGPVAYQLLTTDGILWDEVLLDTFDPAGRLMADPASGMCWRTYHAAFIHLI